MTRHYRTAAVDAFETWELDEPASEVRPRAQALAVPKGDFRIVAGAEAILNEEGYLLPLLDEACSILRTLFGSDSELVLERFDDPESLDGHAMLFLTVLTGIETAEAMRLLERFDEEWWIDHVAQAEGKLQFTVSYR